MQREVLTAMESWSGTFDAMRAAMVLEGEAGDGGKLDAGGEL